MEQGRKRSFLYNWYNISVFAAGLLAVLLTVGDWDMREKMLLGSAAVIFFISLRSSASQADLHLWE